MWAIAEVPFFTMCFQCKDMVEHASFEGVTSITNFVQKMLVVKGSCCSKENDRENIRSEKDRLGTSAQFAKLIKLGGGKILKLKGGCYLSGLI